MGTAWNALDIDTSDRNSQHVITGAMQCGVRMGSPNRMYSPCAVLPVSIPAFAVRPPYGCAATRYSDAIAKRADDFAGDSSIEVVNPETDTSTEAHTAWIAGLEAIERTA